MKLNGPEVSAAKAERALRDQMTHIGVHDPILVALSVLIAALASYTALDLGGRIKCNTGPVRFAWLAAAAVAMGGGIWSMHFVAMLAFMLPGVAVSYDITRTILSLLIPIVVTGVGFALASRPCAGRTSLAVSGVVMGSGIAAMHYLGMSAMQVPADMSLDGWWVAVSLVIAVGAAMVAVWLAFSSRRLRFTIS
jgi:NO-binding membrane sensor protein with MHYT domain